MEIAADQFEVAEETLTYDALCRADETFITSSTKEILPVVQVDEQQVGDGRPGTRTKRLIDLFRTYVAAYREASRREHPLLFGQG